ncbi:hypothetical protein [uncultured Methylobacterium sp.]|jgi:hypothetical protein|uniref:hypothetical protein n=1 Tax=uncultured Methylobacterium sp. TaxID=157278 RepID=UPI00262A1688|nr:hypothetical protein [uncultured Methylobacterium sp.]
MPRSMASSPDVSRRHRAWAHAYFREAKSIHAHFAYNAWMDGGGSGGTMDFILEIIA